jgi:hypothetical protein
MAIKDWIKKIDRWHGMIIYEKKDRKSEWEKIIIGKKSWKDYLYEETKEKDWKISLMGEKEKKDYLRKLKKAYERRKWYVFVLDKGVWYFKTKSQALKFAKKYMEKH